MKEYTNRKKVFIERNDRVFSYIASNRDLPSKPLQQLLKDARHLKEHEDECNSFKQYCITSLRKVEVNNVGK